MTTFDTTYVRDYSPDYKSVFAESGNDAWTLLLKRKNMIASILVTLAIISAIFVLLGGTMKYDPQRNDVSTQTNLGLAFFLSYYVAIIFVSVYGLADSVRTVNPNFKMTFSGIMAMIGLSLLIGLIVDIGLLLVIIPGIWLAVKLSQTIFAYFLRPGRNALNESWKSTDGHFWGTLLFYFLIGIFVGFGMLLPYYLALAAIVYVPYAAIMLVPFVFGIWCFMQYFNALVHVRWTESLLRAQELRITTPMIA
ncbi:MAG: hypothetical protein NVS9B12_03280 [Vulcanimicrobiaceae bacterium]